MSIPSIPMLNYFCRKYDMVFVEEGRVSGVNGYWFIDWSNERKFYTAFEITKRVTAG